MNPHQHLQLMRGLNQEQDSLFLRLIGSCAHRHTSCPSSLRLRIIVLLGNSPVGNNRPSSHRSCCWQRNDTVLEKTPYKSDEAKVITGSEHVTLIRTARLIQPSSGNCECFHIFSSHKLGQSGGYGIRIHTCGYYVSCSAGIGRLPGCWFQDQVCGRKE